MKLLSDAVSNISIYMTFSIGINDPNSKSHCNTCEKVKAQITKQILQTKKQSFKLICLGCGCKHIHATDN